MARILALSSRVPWLPREGHQLRSYHVLEALASRHEVHLLSCLRRDDEPGAPAPLRARLAGFETFPVDSGRPHLALARALVNGTLTRAPFVVAKYALPALTRRVAKLAQQVDIIHVDMLPLMACVPVHAHQPVVLNAHNVEHRLLAARAKVETGVAVRLFLRTQVPKLRAFERAACARATMVLACSDDDAAELRGLAPATPVRVIPNGVDIVANQPDGTVPRAAQMVFVGQMGWFPNRDGVEWFLAEIMPRVLTQRADARFVLVGKHAGLHVPEAVRTHVELAGFVPDVRRPVLESAVYVVPLRAGSGTRLKVLEAMALGKAIVTTTIGAEGIRLEHGREALFADDAQAFADAIVGLMRDPAAVARLGAAARQAAERRYGWRAIGAELLDAYADLASAANDGSRGNAR